MFYNILFSMIYVLMLIWIYDVEFTYFWTYMRFAGEFDIGVLLIAVIGTLLLSVALPTVKSARGIILQIAHYFFYLPSIVYLSFNDHRDEYVVALVISASCVYLGSLLPIKIFAEPNIRRKHLLSMFMSLILFALLLQVIFGGLNNFNLNFEAVYEFRGETSRSMPALFGYVFSNVANVLIPSSIVLALYLRSVTLAVVGALASMMLFGMSHHKAIVFVSIMVFVLYFILTRIRRVYVVAFLPLCLVFVCVLEVIHHVYILPDRQLGIVTSYIVRRTLLVPPMLDVAAVELFTETMKYYWSTSRLGFGIASNPHDVSAPFLMGIHFFDDSGMSANPGNIGSGYSHAGLIGVTIYSGLTGLLISFVNVIGRRSGHALASAISIPTVLLILTSTDLTTALLTHGLFALVVVLSLLPRHGVVA